MAVTSGLGVSVAWTAAVLGMVPDGDGDAEGVSEAVGVGDGVGDGGAGSTWTCFCLNGVWPSLAVITSDTVYPAGGLYAV